MTRPDADIEKALYLERCQDIAARLEGKNGEGAMYRAEHHLTEIDGLPLREAVVQEIQSNYWILFRPLSIMEFSPNTEACSFWDIEVPNVWSEAICIFALYAMTADIMDAISERNQEFAACAECDGLGEVWADRDSTPAEAVRGWVTCTTCEGTGQDPEY